jgi:response regulator RpfG family c-di-GMP phosphodiesterase
MLMTNERLPTSEILSGAQIFVVDNHCDSGDLYAEFLKGYDAKVTTIESIKDALAHLDLFIPDILICEIRFPGESVYPLIERVRYIEQSSDRTIPILITSTCSPTTLAEYLTVKVETYLLKPVDLDYLVAQVSDLLLLSKFTYICSHQN